MHRNLSFFSSLILTCDSLSLKWQSHSKSCQAYFPTKTVQWVGGRNAVREVVRCVCGRPDWKWGRDRDVAPTPLNLFSIILLLIRLIQVLDGGSTRWSLFNKQCFSVSINASLIVDFWDMCHSSVFLKSCPLHERMHNTCYTAVIVSKYADL